MSGAEMSSNETAAPKRTRPKKTCMENVSKVVSTGLNVSFCRIANIMLIETRGWGSFEEGHSAPPPPSPLRTSLLMTPRGNDTSFPDYKFYSDQAYNHPKGSALPASWGKLGAQIFKHHFNMVPRGLRGTTEEIKEDSQSPLPFEGDIIGREAQASRVSNNRWRNVQFCHFLELLNNFVEEMFCESGDT